MSQTTAETLRKLTLVQTLDDKRKPDDLFKLPAFLYQAVTAAKTDLSMGDTSTAPAEGVRTEASETRRIALQELEEDLRGGYAFIAAIDRMVITEAARNGLFETYGWNSGEIGRFDDERRIALGNLVVKLADDTALPAAHHYPAAIVERIKRSLANVVAESDEASGGIRQGVVRRRNEVQESAADTLSRVRHYYCCASADVDQTSELARIDFQPRRERGTVKDGDEEAGETPTVGVGEETKGAPAALSA